MNPYTSYRQHLLDFPKQLSSKAVRVASSKKLLHAKPDGIVVIGMGGSGLPATFLEALAASHRLKVPVSVWKDHGTPKTSFRHPLYVFISFSGNTEETLSGFRAVMKKRGHVPVAVVTGGGTLGRLAGSRHIPLALVPMGGLTPREGVGYLYYNLLSLLRVAFPSLVIRNLSHIIRTGRWERSGKELAKHLTKKVALIYTDSSFAHLGTAWETLLNETAKQPAFSDTYPEIGHNEIVALQGRSRTMAALFLEGKFRSPHEKKHLKAIKKLLAQKGIEVLSIPLAGRTKEEQTWNGFLLGHWTALAIAKRKRVNPTSIPLIEKLKKEVSR